ncbi:hypothetical protein jhhlp_003199 [Lomentospora prolificans]|uniref:Uncharacterized protein n=1 Tax=Lomentospora prolificans TaxID=41688 RepID=A0A2N3NG36_9PEZI|nr:hypothetical protein jhhlp_003199 [Lomentospora prolificans]
MPPKTRSKGQAPASRVYSSSPSLQQIQFPPRRKVIRTYGKQSTKRTGPLKQQTITQIDFLQPVYPEELDGFEGNSHMDVAAGFEEEEEKKRKKKRRKTEGDEPDSGSTSSFHTQTLTQFYGGDRLKKEVSRRTIKDSEDEGSDGGLDEFITTGRRVRINDVEEEISNNRLETKSPSVIPQTPLKKQTRIEIPSSQPSPCTPMLLRYSPLGPRGSPLKSRSTNVGSPLRIGKRAPRTLVIEDSFASAVTLSSGPSQSSARAMKGCGSSSQRISSSQTKQPASGDDETTSEECNDENEDPESQQDCSKTAIIADSDEEGEEDDDPGYLSNQPLEKSYTEPVDVPAAGETMEKQRSTQSAKQPAREEDNYPIGEETQFAFEILASGTELAPPNIQDPSRAASQCSTRKLNSILQTTPKHPRRKAAVAFSSPQFCPEEEDDHAAQHKTQVYTQMNSQRIDLEIIRAMPPPTDRSDIFISIHPEHVEKIVNGTKDHEFRTWKMPSTVSRIWIYVTKPESMLRYMACIGSAKLPGEIANEKGVGNTQFNKGVKRSSYAYEIEELYELNNPVPLKKMKENGWVEAAPQKYTFVPPVVVSQLQANLRCQLLLESDDCVFEDRIQDSQPKQSASLSQEVGEVEAQLLSDIAYSTQHPTSDSRATPVSSQQTPWRLRPSTRQGQKTPPQRVTSSNQKRKRGTPTIPSSQATTASGSPSPSRSQRHSMQQSTNSCSSLIAFHESGSPVRIPEGEFDLRTSQLLSASQLLPETLMRDDESGPPAGCDFDDDL